MTKEVFLRNTNFFRERLRVNISREETLIKEIHEYDQRFAEYYSKLLGIEKDLLNYLDKRVEGK